MKINLLNGGSKVYGFETSRLADGNYFAQIIGVDIKKAKNGRCKNLIITYKVDEGEGSFCQKKEYIPLLEGSNARLDELTISFAIKYECDIKNFDVELLMGKDLVIGIHVSVTDKGIWDNIIFHDFCIENYEQE